MTTNTEALLHGGDVGPDEDEEPEASAVFEVVLGDEEPAEDELDEDEEVDELTIEDEELAEEELDEELDAGTAAETAGAEAPTAGRTAPVVGEADEPDEEEDAEETEADLDVILKERMGAVPAEEEVDLDADDVGEAPTLLATTTDEFRPRGADEFVCRSCFLVKDRRQLADPVNLRCVDCANDH
ncbi:MAG: DUF4193 family protein [Actinomycetota bacterium]|nr:DUF4193 family protein [Actinomycetota bacterium]